MTRTRHLNPRGTIGRRNREGKGSSASKKRSGRVRIIALDRNLMTRAPATMRWTEKSSAFHSTGKCFQMKIGLDDNFPTDQSASATIE